jgi:hypothetical protein
MSNGPTFSLTQLTEPSSFASSSPLPTNFDTTTALILANACALTYAQYAQGSSQPITSTQLADLNTGSTNYTFSLLATFTSSESLGFGAAQTGPGAFVTLPFGFLVQATENNTAQFNILALRGTQTYAEWLNDIDAVPATFDLADDAGDVHAGFYGQYTVGTDGTPSQSGSRPAGSLAQQIGDLFGRPGRTRSTSGRT